MRSSLSVPEAVLVRPAADTAAAPALSDAPCAAEDPGWSYTISVRSFCEFTAKRGDLDRRFTPSATATEGQAGEAAALARRGVGYQKQVALSGVFQGLRVRGRADGFDPASGTLEEIKTIRGPVEAIPANRRLLHRAQLETYGALHCRQHGVDEVQLALVYMDADTHEEVTLRERRFAVDLERHFMQRCGEFLSWAQQEAEHRTMRDAALTALPFPLPAFRAGQRTLAEAVYRAAVQGRCLLAQAPTGIGKTLGVLYPVLRAMPGRRLDKIAFLTCKNSGRLAALEALHILREKSAGKPLRVLQLSSRERACAHPGKACHAESCSLAQGFYDRLPAARQDAVTQEWLDQAAVRDIALRHGICPYYLGQEMLRWTDVVVGDVHHAFDMSGQLHGLTQALDWRVGLLIDEAHNLIERTRQMYGAELRLARVDRALERAPGELQAPLRAFLRVALRMACEANRYVAHDELPTDFSDVLGSLNAAFAGHFQSQTSTPGPLLDVFFSTLQLQWAGDRLGSHAFFDITRDVTADDQETGLDRQPVQQGSPLDADPDGDTADAVFRVRNLVPGAFLQRRWDAFQTVTLFSATLGSERFQRDLLGLPESTVWLDVPSPFDPDHLRVQIAKTISTRYAHRTRSLDAIVDLMGRQLAKHPGNYLAFFSSFAYLEQAAARLAARWPELPLWKQSPAMDETSQGAFLRRFVPGGFGIGFAVLGGAFAEGVDLPGGRLIGAFVATLGLPPVSPAQTEMYKRLAARFGADDGYADLLPGMQKVVQAAGRVIRTPEDKGWVWLLDDRYGRSKVRALLPAAWRLNQPREVQLEDRHLEHQQHQDASAVAAGLAGRDQARHRRVAGAEVR